MKIPKQLTGFVFCLIFTQVAAQTSAIPKRDGSLTNVDQRRSAQSESLSSTATARLVIQSSGPFVPFSVAYSSDGKYVLSGGADRTAKLWDAESGRELKTFSGHRGMVTSVAFSPNSRFALSGSNDKTLKLWDIKTGTEILAFQGSKYEISSVAFSPNGQYVLSGSHDEGISNIMGEGGGGSVVLWDASTGKKIRTFLIPPDVEESAYSVAFSPNGKYVASGTDYGKVCVWEAVTGKLLQQFVSEGKRRINSVAISPDNAFIVAGGNHETLAVWDIRKGTRVWSQTGEPVENRVQSVAFSADGKFVASGGIQLKNGELIGVLKWLDSSSGKEHKVFAAHREWIASIAFSPDAHVLISASADGTIKFWDIDTWSVSRSIKGHADSIGSLALSKDGRYLLTASGFWLTFLAKALVYPEDVSEKVAVALEALGTLNLWDLSTGEVVRTLRGHKLGIGSVAISPDNKYAASAGFDNSVKLWELLTERELLTLTPEQLAVPDEDFTGLFVSFSPDGRYLLTATKNGKIVLWETATGKKYREFESTSNDLLSVAFLPDSQSIIVSDVDALIRYDISTGKSIQRYEDVNGEDLTSTFVTNDGQLLLAGGKTTIQIRETSTGKLVKELTGFPENVVRISFSPDGRYALLSRENRPSIIWDTSTGKQSQTLSGSDISIRFETFSSDGRYIFSGSQDATVRIWQVNENKRDNSPLCTLTAFQDETWAVVDSAGRYDASHGGDVEGLHWVVNNEPITLAQLKGRYYDPGLLAKLTGYNKQALRTVKPLREVELYPLIEYAAPTSNSTLLNIKLTSRGGGIGKVSVFVNGKEVIENARPASINSRAPNARITVDLSRAHLLQNVPNSIQVKAWNAEGYLVSRGVRRIWNTPVGRKRPPELYAIIGGVSNYASSDLNLKFTTNDAESMAKAVEIGALRLLGPGKVHLTLLADSTNPIAMAPSKANFAKAFEMARQSRPEDILFVYLAGHGLAFKGGDGDDYCYLTSDAVTSDLSDPNVRAQTAITSEELTAWIKQIPALKQVMILDTCAAEAAAKKLVAVRNTPVEQILALERLADRTGFHVLMGSSADAVSYEASKYRQGLLTYSLLTGMRGAALRNDEYVDVSKLFQYAVDSVPQLARNIGGIQKPHIAAPKAESFDIGQLKSEDKSAIPVAMVYPLILSPRLTNAARFFDDLQLTQALRKKLIEKSHFSSEGGPTGAEMVFVNAEELPGALLPSGAYVIENETINVNLILVKDNQEVARFTVKGSKDALDDLIEEMVTNIGKSAKKFCCDN